MKLSDLVVLIIALVAPGVLLAAGDGSGQPTANRGVAPAIGVYAADGYTKATWPELNDLAVNPVKFADDPSLYSPAAALLASLNWLLDVNAGNPDAAIAIHRDDTDATVFLADAGLRWKPSSHVGFGLSYTMSHLNDEYRNDSIGTGFNRDALGPRFSLEINF